MFNYGTTASMKLFRVITRIMCLNLPYLYSHPGTLNACFSVLNVMRRTQSRLGNDNKNQQPEPRIVEHALEAMLAPEPIRMAIIRALLVEQMEEMQRLIQKNGREPTVPVMQPKLNEEKSEEGNYSRTMSHMEPQVVRRNNPELEIKKRRCKYWDFTICKSSTFSRKECDGGYGLDLRDVIGFHNLWMNGQVTCNLDCSFV